MIPAANKFDEGVFVELPGTIVLVKFVTQFIPLSCLMFNETLKRICFFLLYAGTKFTSNGVIKDEHTLIKIKEFESRGKKKVPLVAPH